MNRFGVVVGGLVFLGMGSALRADEPPHAEFVRGLRAKHYSDLALEYVEKVLRTASAEAKPGLLLERAKTRLDLAATEPEVGRRLVKYNEARGELEAFVKQYGGHALASEASLELAHVAVLQGKTQLGVALKQENPQTRIAEAARARVLFEQAGAQLQAAATAVDAAYVAKFKDKEPDTAEGKAEKRALEQARVQAELDVAMNYIDQAYTYVEENKDEVLLKRAEVIKKAQPTLQKLAKGDPRSPSTYQAQAWLARTLNEIGRPADAYKMLNSLIADKAPEAETGKRLARYFLILTIPQVPTIKEDRAKLVQTTGEAWLKAYPAFVNTPEGDGVRFALAQSYLGQAINAEKGTIVNQAALNRALDLYKQLELTDNEYTERARQQKVGILVKRSGGDINRPINQIGNFDDCLIRAQMEYQKLSEDAKKTDDRDKLKKIRDTHFQNVIDVLNQGFRLAKSPAARVPKADLENAQAMLAFTYLNREDYANAVKAGEELARTASKESQAAARAATYALEAYVRLEGKEDELRSLAEYMENTWRDDVAGDMGRHQLGSLLIKDKKYVEAVEKLKQVKPTYPLYTVSQYEMALAALQAQDEGAKPPAPEKRSYAEQALAALKAIAEPTAADPTLQRVYVYAKLKLGHLLYEQKQYEQLELVVAPLQKKFPELNVGNEQTQEELKGGIATLALLSAYGRGEKEYGQGRYGDARKLIDPIVEQIKGDKLPILQKSTQLRLALLSLGLRANVQDGQAARAQEILKLLQDSTKGNELEQGSAAILMQLAQSLRSQVNELKKKGDSAKEQLDKTVTSFSGFLDELAKQEKATPETLLFLAQSYAGLDQHGKAAELLAKFPEPKAEEGKPADAKQLSQYHQSKLLLARELRLAKQYEQASAQLKALRQTDWGKASLEVRKEEVLILEDRELYGGQGGAVRSWFDLMNQLRQTMQRDARLKDMYYECYYHFVFCSYKNALKIPDQKKKTQALQQAAGYIVKLEDSQKDWGGEVSKKRFEELLEHEKMLKQYYDEQRKVTKQN